MAEFKIHPVLLLRVVLERDSLAAVIFVLIMGSMGMLTPRSILGE